MVIFQIDLYMIIYFFYSFMNFFNFSNVAQGMINYMNASNNSGSNQKQLNLRKQLEHCTYPDETKYVVQKSIKQVFHVYPFFNSEVLSFTEAGFQKRYIELKGILQIQIKGKICKVDFNMMLPADFPRSSPFVRIVNRNTDYKVDPYYQQLRSKTDVSSYILNQKLNTAKNWHPSSSLVNVIIECYDILKSRFPFSKPVQELNSYGGGNEWDNLYNKNKNSNFGGGGFTNSNPNYNNTNNNGWKNPNKPVSGWNTNSNQWGANNNWSSNQNNNWVNNNSNNNNNNWGNNNGWGGNTNNNWAGNQIGGMGALSNNNNYVNNIVSAQKYVASQKKTIEKLNINYQKVLEKVQILELTKKSLQTEQNYLRRENFEMLQFLKENQQSSSFNLASIVQPSDMLSEQILDVRSSIRARQQSVLFLQNKFNQQQLSLDQFMKYVRKIQEQRFQEKVLLIKCVNEARLNS